MPNLKLLILDANIVIHLFELGLWGAVLEKWEIHLASVVAFQEAEFYFDGSHAIEIDLNPFIASGQLKVFETPAAKLQNFKSQFDSTYLERLDPGETESLVFLLDSPEEFLISSADAIVFRILGNLSRSDQGISLEEILRKSGISQANLKRQYTKAFREQKTTEGARDSLFNKGRKT